MFWNRHTKHQCCWTLRPLSSEIYSDGMHIVFVGYSVCKIPVFSRQRLTRYHTLLFPLIPCLADSTPAFFAADSFLAVLCPVASLGEGDRPGWHHPGGDTRLELFLWLKLERTPDKRRGQMGVVRRRQLKKVITFQRAMTEKVVSFVKGKIGWHHQLPSRVTPTLVTSLFMSRSLNVSAISCPSQSQIAPLRLNFLRFESQWYSDKYEKQGLQWRTKRRHEVPAGPNF